MGTTRINISISEEGKHSFWWHTVKGTGDRLGGGGRGVRFCLGRTTDSENTSTYMEDNETCSIYSGC